jgi:serine/threonine protein kinase
MQAYHLSKKFKNKYHHLIGDKIGDGADGDVYTINNDPSKVIKYVVYYCWNSENLNQVIEQKLATYSAIKADSSLFANLYDYGFIGQDKRITVDGEQDYLLFYCVMEKLDKISPDESKVFHSVVSHEDNNVNKNYSISKIESMLSGLSLGLDFDKGKVVSFIKKIKSCKVKYNDLHPRNIMKDSSGEFKLIDFDRVEV